MPTAGKILTMRHLEGRNRRPPPPHWSFPANSAWKIKAETPAIKESIGTHDSTKVLAIMLPRPRAAPVTRQTLPSIEKDARVRLVCRPKSPRCISWPGCLSAHFYMVLRVSTDAEKSTFGYEILWNIGTWVTGTPQADDVGITSTDMDGMYGKTHLGVFKRDTLVDGSDLGLNLDSMLLITIVLLVADKSRPGEGSKRSGSKSRSPEGTGSGLEEVRTDEGHSQKLRRGYKG